MIDLTPLDVRKKKGDFRRGLRGYDPPHVDDFLDIVADRLEALVRENNALLERVARFEQQVTDYREREKALTETLVTAQEMREEMRAQTAREGDMARRQAEQEAVRIKGDAVQAREREEDTLRKLRARQLQFLQTYRSYLEREMAELASMTRGLEMNGALADPLETPGGGAARPDAVPVSGTGAGEAPSARTAPRPGADPWTAPGPPAASPDEWASASSPAPPRPERTAFAAGVSGSNLTAQAAKAEPPAARPKDPPKAPGSTGGAAHATTGVEPRAGSPAEPRPAAPRAGSSKANRAAARLDTWETAAAPGEGELILSDEDLLPELPAPGRPADRKASQDTTSGTARQGRGSPIADAFGPEFADLDTADLSPDDDEIPDLTLETQSLIGMDDDRPAPAPRASTPPASGGGAKSSEDLGLDLVPELEDFSEFGDLTSEAGGGRDDFGMLPPIKPGPPPASGPKRPAVPPPARKPQDPDDDADDLLKSLFGDDS